VGRHKWSGSRDRDSSGIAALVAAVVLVGGVLLALAVAYF
jgi:hypothetical protein